jgi:hypothetical protein
MWTCEAGGPEVGVEELRTFSNIAGARGGPVGVRPRSHAEPPPAADCLQRPLRSRFRQQLRRSVDMTSNVKSGPQRASRSGRFG